MCLRTKKPRARAERRSPLRVAKSGHDHRACFPPLTTGITGEDEELPSALWSRGQAAILMRQ
jgi:hypothetical protein